MFMAWIYLSLSLSLPLCFFSFLSDITRQLHHFPLKLLFLHLPICHLPSRPRRCYPICLRRRCLCHALRAALYGSIIFLTCLFWFVDPLLELYLAPWSGQIPLKLKTRWYFMLPVAAVSAPDAGAGEAVGVGFHAADVFVRRSGVEEKNFKRWRMICVLLFLRLLLFQTQTEVWRCLEMLWFKVKVFDWLIKLSFGCSLFPLCVFLPP